MWKFWTRHSIADLSVKLPVAELRKRCKIVVVDDDEDSFPTKALQADGYTIEWWEKISPAGLQRLENSAFDIVILDIQGIAEPSLSDTGDGLGVLRRVKAANPGVVVVAFSGRTYDLDSVPFWKLADDALRKPVTLIQCKELLDRLIEKNISVLGYWDNIRRVLKNAGVTDERVHKLEKLTVKAAKDGRVPSFDQIKDVVGSINTLVTIATWVQKLISLSTLST